MLQPSKEATDEEYNKCAAMLLEAAVGGDGGSDTAPTASLLLASHNRESVHLVAEAMRQRGVPSDHPNVHFAQILGMADDLTLTMGLSGFNAHKLVPFGAFEEVLPWMLRRLEENHDALGAAACERPLLREEIRRRAAAAFGVARTGGRGGSVRQSAPGG